MRIFPALAMLPGAAAALALLLAGAAAWEAWRRGRELKRLRQRLGEEAARRAALEAELAARTAQLDRTGRELEAFSYSISHDLRAPLRSIEGFSAAVEGDPENVLSARSRESFQRVRRATAKMGQLIDELVKLSRVSRADLKVEPLDLGGLARSVVEELRRQQPERAVEVVIAEGLMAQGDAKLIRILLENLLSNAWKFTEKTASPRIELGSRLEGSRRVYFVRDNGAGFDPRHVAKLFTPFQRLHAANEFPGAGVGLAMVRRVISRHGGEVWAEGTPGLGATFFFTLPG